MSVRVFKYGSLLLSVAGVVVLLFAAIRSETPSVRICDLRGTMNWAYVRIEGIVSRQPSHDPETGDLKVWVWDGTGEILVIAYGSEAEWLMAESLVPVMGDTVAVEGTLRVRDDFQYLVVDVPQNAEVQAGEPAEMSIGDVDVGLLYQKVTVRGVIRDAQQPYEGLRLLALRDTTGEIDVAFESAGTVDPGLPDLDVGQSVQVTGAVDRYRGMPQISVGRGSDIVVLQEAVDVAPVQRIDQLHEEETGSMVLVEGTVTKVSPFASGVRLVLNDDSGTVTVILWQDLWEVMVTRDMLIEGARVRAQGEVVEYGGELEIVPELPSDVTVLATASRGVDERRLGGLSFDDVGQMVVVEGVLRTLRTFSAGVRGTLYDGTGTVTLLLWQEVYDGLPDPTSLAPGTILRVEGEVGEYKGELEVVPRMPIDVEITGVEKAAMITSTPTTRATSQPSATLEATLIPTPEQPPQPTPRPTAKPLSSPTVSPTSTHAPTAETRNIGAITGDSIGVVCTIAQAAITDIDYFSEGVKYTLTDGTGSIILLVWQDVMEEVPDHYSLFPGSQVRVRGEVMEYQGDLEIVPGDGADIVVVVQGERPSIEERAVSNITPADEGRIFVVEGTVTRTESHQWLKVWINDRTGEMLVFVPERTVEYLPAGIGAGVRLRVTGEVDIYQGVLEIIPLAGADVEVR